MNNAEKQENNRMGKTRDLFKTTVDSKAIFHAKIDTIKNRNSKELTETDEIKKRWQEYTEELGKKKKKVLVTQITKMILPWWLRW